jgi:hypothetical protein
MGTPHQGSRLADWATIIGRIVKFANFGANTNADLLNSLKDSAPILFEISKSFADRSGLAILSFYELDNLPSVGFRVGFLPFCSLKLVC